MSDNESSEVEVSSPKKRRRQHPKIDKSVNWSRETVYKLIDAVAEQKCIWNKRCSDYRDLSKRTAAWMQIEAESFENMIPHAQLKKKWQLLCQTLCKNIAWHNKSKSNRKITWEYWDAMAFLRQRKMDYPFVSVSDHSTPRLPESIKVESQTDSLDTFGNFFEAEEAFDNNEDTFAKPISPTSSTRNVPTIPVRQSRQRNRLRLRTPAERSTSSSSNNSLLETVSLKHRSTKKSRLKHHDKFDEFGNFIASTLRQMSPNFAERAMAQLNYSLSLLHIEAAALRLRRTRLPTAPNIKLLNSDSTLTDYYLFGDKEEPYDPKIHSDMYVTNQNGYLVNDKYIRSNVEEAYRNNSNASK